MEPPQELFLKIRPSPFEKNLDLPLHAKMKVDFFQICFATCALAFYQCFSIKPFLTLKRLNSESQTAVVNNNRLKYLLCLITWVLSTGASVTSQLFNADCSDVFARYSNFIISWSVFIGMFVLCSFITLGLLVMTYSRISRARSLLPQRMKMVDTVSQTPGNFEKNK